MTTSRTGMRADMAYVAQILSRPTFRLRTAEPDDPFEMSTVEDILAMESAFLMEIKWETGTGLHGPDALYKHVIHGTMGCPECGTEGRYDDYGQVVCDNDRCGVVISGDKPLILPEDEFDSSRCNTGATHLGSDKNLYSKPALNDAAPEPDESPAD